MEIGCGWHSACLDADAADMLPLHIAIYQPWLRRALSLDGWRHVAFIDDGLGALTALSGVASLNLQGCTALTDRGLGAIGHMTSLACVNLQDCRQISGEAPVTVPQPPSATCRSLAGKGQHGRDTFC